MPTLLTFAALGQIAIALINLRLDRLLGWQSQLAALPLLMREVFHVHKWFITITLLIFGIITLRFAAEIAGGDNPMARWLAAGIGGFWAIRTAIQWLYYDSSHWRGQPGRTAIHWILTLAYGGCAAVYWFVAFR
ncbi:MAG: hypothetical protein JNK37_13790 [Verrucomicrobiales bacterium]|nr:hypothetical protein [Verrucomicrobiales bacterium]